MNINELKQISFQKAEGFENIYFLNGFSSNKNNKERILYRYRPFLSALKDVRKKIKNAVHFFVDYVKERNVSLMTKAEWEQLYFYCTSKNRRLKR